LLGVFMGQDGHNGSGGHAVFQGVEPCAGLFRDGPGPSAFLRIEAVGFDLCRGGHGCKLSGGVDHGEDGGS
jgi:hypothetical protein